MVFRKRKERTDRLLNELRLGEFWLMPGEFRAEEATAGMTGSYGLPGGYGALAASAEQKEALMKAVSAALKSMSSDAQDYINSNFGNTTQYLKNRIEAQIDANHVAAKQAAAQNTLNLG